LFELITGGDYLFDPASGSRYSKDDDHIAQIIELLGEIPKGVAFSGKYSHEFFNRKGMDGPFWIPGDSYVSGPGELRHINKLRYWPLNDVLNQKYLFPRAEAEGLASFLSPMLRLHPDRRAKASELIHHNFLDGIVVQGEVDVIRRLELEEADKRKQRDGEGNGVVTMSEVVEESESGQVESVQDGQQKQQQVTALDQSERDAMKPVDDSSIMVEEEGEVEYDDEPPITMQHRDHQNQVPLLNQPAHAQKTQNQKPPQPEKKPGPMRS